MRQVTLVAHYGAKSGDFADLIQRCQRRVRRLVGAAFAPYDVRQVHGTIIGLEQCLNRPGCNANFARHRGREMAMDFTGFLGYLRGSGHFPLGVQIGGFARRPYPFRSRDQTPFERSFSIQAGMVVVLGWPVRTGSGNEARQYPPTLEAIRQGAQHFGVLHRYHRAAADTDNDFFFRIGTLDPRALTPSRVTQVEDEMRRFLSGQRPLVIEIRLEDVSVAAYDDERLPLGSTRTWTLAAPEVTGEFVSGLYR